MSKRKQIIKLIEDDVPSTSSENQRNYEKMREKGINLYLI